jgi:anti-sigma B factor antagonist
VPASRILPRQRSTELSIVQRSVGQECRLSLRGEVDLATAPDLERALQEAESQAPQRILLDLSALRFIDSTGLHVLCAAYVRAEDNARSLVLEGASTHIRNLLGMVGLDGLLGGAGPVPRVTA